MYFFSNKCYLLILIYYFRTISNNLPVYNETTSKSNGLINHLQFDTDVETPSMQSPGFDITNTLSPNYNKLKCVQFIT